MLCEALTKSLHNTDFAISIGNRSGGVGGGGEDCIYAYAIALGKLIKSGFKRTNEKRIFPICFIYETMMHLHQFYRLPQIVYGAISVSTVNKAVKLLTHTINNISNRLQIRP